MKKTLICFVALICSLTAFAQQEEFFTPYKIINLRLPSVPLVVNDPYFSIWSSYDKLTDGSTNYWYSRDVKKPLVGMLRVDSTVYRFMGSERECLLKNAILPMADVGIWEAPATFTRQRGTGWTAIDFDDSEWEVMQGAMGVSSEYPNVHTAWSGENTDIYVRRTMTLTAEDLEKDLWVKYSHDDVFELYINGVRVVQTGETWLQGEIAKVSDAAKASLVVGENIVAAHCHNTTGGAYIDFGVYENNYIPVENLQTASQVSVDVLATNTYYTFNCGPVKLNLVFTAPMLIDDLDLLSTPINYISYQVTSTDGNEHDVQIYLSASPEIAISNSNTFIRTFVVTSDLGFKYARAGYTGGKIHETGSYAPIDWGFLYLPELNGTISANEPNLLEHTFAAEGKLPETLTSARANNLGEAPELAYTYDFGKITKGSNFALIGYDEINDVKYNDQNYKGYWARNGKTIVQAFKEMYDNYNDIMTRCREMDKRIYDDGKESGNLYYAEVLSASYRQCIAAHKLFEDSEGDLMFFSRENNSGGFINTVDVTYPSTPLFFMYNHDLARALITSVFKYCGSSRWGFNFANHDLGHYPVAKNQHYAITRPDDNGGFGGNMPIEESANILTITATLCMLDGNTDYADRFWDLLTTWASYLLENGLDPEDQLCTDDFAGRLAHNANLSIKAIMGIAGYALIAKMKGLNDTYESYMNSARQMAAQWEENAITEDNSHYRLTFDGNDNTWSLKYNLVWDKLWQTGLFSDDVYTREIAYYKSKNNSYGPPLDNRRVYTKSDWVEWAAALASTKADFQVFNNKIWSYINSTSSRVPISDWYYTDSSNMVGFRARSVVGGHWMKVLMDNFQDLINDQTGIGAIQTNNAVATPEARYNINGQKISQAERGVNIIRYSDGSTRKVIVK